MSMAEDDVQRTEERLRAGLEAVLGVAPGTVLGSSRLEELIVEGKRREVWAAWEKASGVALPALDHPLQTKMGWFAGGFVAALFVLAALRTVGVHVPGSTMAGGVIGVLLGAVGLRMLGGKAVGLPMRVQTVADLAAGLGARRG